MHNFKKLKVYDRAIAFATLVNREPRRSLLDERFGLTSQLRQAACWLASNIAEGTSNVSARDFGGIQDLSVRSEYECIACYDIALRMDYLSNDSHGHLVNEVAEIVAMLVGLKRSLSK
jgi:four helix bundle protein